MKTTTQLLQDNVLNILERNCNCTSISHVMQELRYDRWKNLGSLDSFANTLRELGFTVTHVYKANGRTVARTNISI